MIKRTIDVSEAAYLRLKNQQLLIERDSVVVGSVPIEDLGVLILQHSANRDHAMLIGCLPTGRQSRPNADPSAISDRS